MSNDPYNPMDMKALLCFATMAKHGSLTRASIELGISDAAVSQRIRSLEKHLGAKLYEARGGKVRLTEAGNRTKTMATRMFDQLSELEDEVLDHEYRGTIVLSAGAAVIRYQLPQVVSSFRQEYRMANMRLLSRGTTETIELVRRNEVDAGVIPFPQSMPSELVFHPWRKFKAFVLIPRDHPLVRRKVPTLKDILNKETLSQFPQVIPAVDNRENQRVRDTLKRLGLPFNVSLEVGDLDMAKHYAATGHGLAVVNGVCLSNEDKQKFHMIEIPEDYDSDITYGVILLKGKYVSSALGALLQFLEVPFSDQ